MLLAASAIAVALAAPSAARAPKTIPAGAVPLGRLPAAARPVAYRIELTVLPEAQGFSGHSEIDVTIAKPTRTLYLHGLGLTMQKATATLGGALVAARWTEVDPSGVVRLDFDSPLPAGRTTLTFDYTAPFMTGSEGLYHAKVGDDWYAWTQMEPIDARRMFPGFDEPGFKTPFTIGITTHKDLKAFANTPEVRTTSAAGGLVRHEFAASKPLPTYLVAVAVGDFDVVEGPAPANAVRTGALPYRVIATKGQKARLATAAAEGPKILALHEDYFGIAYPYEKLDQIASPVMQGAMENAGLVTYNDTLLLLSPDAPPSQRRGFGTVVAHELAHQWFGDLVTPVWWNDIWLNESFAEWAGNRVGQIWDPKLGTGVAQLSEALDAMEIDSLPGGRPIRQPIATNAEIASAFDSITYQKGGQVLTMVESYLGPDKFRAGVRTHLDRFRYGNATAEDFFASMAKGSGDPGIVPVFQSFVDQTGVPVVTIRPVANGWRLSQARYRPIGVAAGKAQTWTLPFCVSEGGAATPTCTLMRGPTATLALKRGGLAVPNAGGAGYYRYSLTDANWRPLVDAAAGLPDREAIALSDSLWADFAAGNVAFERVLDGTRALAAHPNRVATGQLPRFLDQLAFTTFSPAATQGYRRLIGDLYAPRMRDMGLDLRADAYAREDGERAQTRRAIAGILAGDARDPAVRRQLADAAEASLSGNARALDTSYRDLALRVAVQDRGKGFMDRLLDAAARSQDPLFRSNAIGALGAAETPEQVQRALAMAQDERLQSTERLRLMFNLAGQPAGRDALFAMLSANWEAAVANIPAFVRPRLPMAFASYCDRAKADAVDALFRPRLATQGGGALELRQATTAIRNCAALKAAKGAEMEAALTR
jgi:aminopeptidase N